MTLHVLYNGQCPICAPEIDIYRRAAVAAGADIVFENLHATDLAPWGLDSDSAQRRFHARLGARRLEGLDAFAALWSRLPRWRVLAWLVTRPGVNAVARWLYDRALAPWLYARAQRRTCALPQA